MIMKYVKANMEKLHFEKVNYQIELTNRFRVLQQTD